MQCGPHARPAGPGRERRETGKPALIVGLRRYRPVSAEGVPILVMSIFCPKANGTQRRSRHFRRREGARGQMRTNAALRHLTAPALLTRRGAARRRLGPPAAPPPPLRWSGVPSTAVDVHGVGATVLPPSRATRAAPGPHLRAARRSSAPATSITKQFASGRGLHHPRALRTKMT